MAVMAHGVDPRVRAHLTAKNPGALPAAPPLQYGTREETRCIHDYLLVLNALGFRTLVSRPASCTARPRGARVHQRASVCGLLEPDTAAWLQAELARQHPEFASASVAADGCCAPPADERLPIVVAHDGDGDDDKTYAWTCLMPAGRLHLDPPPAAEGDATTRLVHIEIVDTRAFGAGDSGDDERLFAALVALLRDPARPEEAASTRMLAAAKRRCASEAVVANQMMPLALLDALCDTGFLPCAVQLWQHWRDGPAQVAFVDGMLEVSRAHWLILQLTEHHPAIEHAAPGRPLAAALRLESDDEQRSGFRACGGTDARYAMPTPIPRALADVETAPLMRVRFVFGADWAFHNHYLLSVLVLRMRACPEPCDKAFAATIAAVREECPHWCTDVLH
jgi:hypothetical protein